MCTALRFDSFFLWFWRRAMRRYFDGEYDFDYYLRKIGDGVPGYLPTPKRGEEWKLDLVHALERQTHTSRRAMEAGIERRGELMFDYGARDEHDDYGYSSDDYSDDQDQTYMTFANAFYGMMSNLMGGWPMGYGGYGEDDSEYYSEFSEAGNSWDDYSDDGEDEG